MALTSLIVELELGLIDLARKHETGTVRTEAGRDRAELARGRARLDTLDQFAASAFADDVRAQFVETAKRCPVKVVDRQKDAPSAILPLDAEADVARPRSSRPNPVISTRPVHFGAVAVAPTRPRASRVERRDFPRVMLAYSFRLSARFRQFSAFRRDSGPNSF